MNADKYVLDTSALLTLMEEEDGTDRVEAILRQGQLVIPFAVLLEIYYISLREHTEATADYRYALICNLPRAEIHWNVDEPTLLTAARFKGQCHVSFADALIAAFAAQHHAILVHKDPEFDALKGRILQEPLPYK